MIKGHGGNIYDASLRLRCHPSEIIDMSSNINPLGPPPGLQTHLTDNLAKIVHLPDVAAEKIIRRFARYNDLDPSCILAGNGTTQFIYTAPLALRMEKALIIGPTYADYADACRMHHVEFDHYLFSAHQDFNADISGIESRIPGYDTVIICNPNNPTGGLLAFHELERLCTSHPKTRFVIDESYLPFVSQDRKVSMLTIKAPNVIILHSLSKIFRIPGLRIGFMVAAPQIIAQFKRYHQPWSVNCLAQAACEFLLRPDSNVEAFILETQRFLENERHRFQELNTSPYFHVFPSTTTFMLIRLSGHISAEVLCSRMLDEKFLLRSCTNFYGLSNRFVRISLRTSELNRLLIQSLLRLSAKISESSSRPQPISPVLR